MLTYNASRQLAEFHNIDISLSVTVTAKSVLVTPNNALSFGIFMCEKFQLDLIYGTGSNLTNKIRLDIRTNELTNLLTNYLTNS